MALPLGTFSTFLAAEPSSPLLAKPFSSSSSSLRFLPSTLQPSLANLRTSRRMTFVATASKPATDTKPKEPKGIMKPRRVSPEMKAFLGGVEEIPRTQALKEIWAYIKKHELQDPANKKVIVCDEELKKIFAGKERVGFLEIAGLIGPHFLK